MFYVVVGDKEALTLGIWRSVESKTTMAIDVLRGVGSRKELCKFLLT